VACRISKSGAGNLLGSSQSGHIAAVGFGTFSPVDEKAVRELRGEGRDGRDYRHSFHLPAIHTENYVEDAAGTAEPLSSAVPLPFQEEVEASGKRWVTIRKDSLEAENLSRSSR